MQPINLYIFIHDDLSSVPTHLLGRLYFKNFTEEITRLTGREFIFHVLKNMPGITDLKYEGRDSKWAIDRWKIAALEYKNKHNLAWDKTNRYILVTEKPINDQVLGISYEGQPPLIASVKHYQVIAHEIGHSFAATHEDAELSTNEMGYRCETYLYPEVNLLQANCYRYSLKNRARIKAFLSDAP